MILASLNQVLVPLEIHAEDPSDGSDKGNVVSGTARVYSVSGGESNILAPTALVNVSGSKWRYEWNTGGSLAVGQYTVEYSLIDSDGIVANPLEVLMVRDIATQTTLVSVQSSLALAQDDLDVIRAVETGRWRIDDTAYTMTFYGTDGTTPLIVFNLTDENGNPSVDRVFERLPA